MELGEVAEVEGVALEAWPALEVVPLDGWLVRHAHGITRRANSVWPNAQLGTSKRAIETAVTKVEQFYHARNLPARYQICPAAQPAHLDGFLERRGYRAVALTAVQTMPLVDLQRALQDAPPFAIEVARQSTAAWWSCYAEADGVEGASVAVRQAICTTIRQATAYAMAMHKDGPIAVGSAAVHGKWMGFFNIATLPAYRRKGAARALLARLVVWGLEQGATRAYLQVMADNDAARQLYGRLGFSTGYYYHYREEAS